MNRLVAQKIRSNIKQRLGTYCGVCYQIIDWKDRVPYNKGTDLLHKCLSLGKKAANG